MCTFRCMRFKSFKYHEQNSLIMLSSQLNVFHNSWRQSIITTVHRMSMMTSSNGNIFRVTGPLCGEFTGHWWIPLKKASDAELWYLFILCLNKRLSKQSRGWWFETLSRPLWRHCNAEIVIGSLHNESKRTYHGTEIQRRNITSRHLWYMSTRNARSLFRSRISNPI